MRTRPGSGQLGKLLRLPAGERHRLLNQDVLSHPQTLASPALMRGTA